MASFWISQAAQEIAVIAFFISIFSIVVRMKVMDMEKYKKTQKDMKEKQKILKEAQKKKDLKVMQKAQEEMMGHMMENMRESMKPMIFTLIPIILVFGWMGNNYGGIGVLQNVTVVDVLPGNLTFKDVSVSHNGSYDPSKNEVTWNLSAVSYHETGNLSVDLTLDSSSENILPKFKNNPSASFHYWNGTFEEDGARILELKRSDPYTVSDGGKIQYVISYTNPYSYAVSSVFGYELGWLGTYIITVMVFSMIFGKVFKTM